MTRKNITDKIFLLEFDTRKELTKTFIRPQEYYESPEFKGKYFTHREFIKWYSEGGKFTYHQDWCGFNIPGEILDPFKDGRFGKLSKQEEKLLETFKDDVAPFYIIGIEKSRTPEQIELDIKHELMHALYHTDVEYRKLVDLTLDSYGLIYFKMDRDYTEIYDFLEESGYHHDVLKDELHAYLVTCHEELEEAGIKVHTYNGVIHSLNELYEETIKKHANISAVS